MKVCQDTDVGVEYLYKPYQTAQSNIGVSGEIKKAVLLRGHHTLDREKFSVSRVLKQHEAPVPIPILQTCFIGLYKKANTRDIRPEKKVSLTM